MARDQAATCKIVRQHALARDGGCRACGSTRYLHRHEEPPRSRGGNPAVLSEVVMLCDRCHRRRHPGAFVSEWLTIRILDAAQGTNGPLEFTEYTVKAGIRTWLSTVAA